MDALILKAVFGSTIKMNKMDKKLKYALIGGSLVLYTSLKLTLAGYVYTKYKTEKSQGTERKLEVIADVDTFETLIPVHESKKDNIYFIVYDRKNKFEYGAATGGNLKLYNINHDIVFDKDFQQNEVVQFKSSSFSEKKYRVKYSVDNRQYNIIFQK